MSISLLFILIIALIAAAIPYVARSFCWNRFIKHVNKKQYDLALQDTEGKLFTLLFGEVSCHWNQLKIYLECKDDKQICQKTNELLNAKLSQKQRYQLTNSIYFYFLDTENQEMAKKVKDHLDTCCKDEEKIYNDILYRVFIEKKADDIETCKELLAQSPNHSKEQGLLEYLLGLQYQYNKDKKNSLLYFEKAKNDLKGTPYHNKIKKQLASRKGE